MDVRHLKAFLATYETGSVTAAAQRIHVTQPTLSATLQQLEDNDIIRSAPASVERKNA